jgi:UDP-3-O-[3-hydroxymyristoyl] glucosamine N-acyltransferase
VTTDVRIGRHVHIDRNCNVGHNVAIGEFTTLYPSAIISGNTYLGSCCEIGTNSAILQRLKIANQTRVGAGAVVTKDVEEPNYTYVGVPARKLVPR